MTKNQIAITSKLKNMPYITFVKLRAQNDAHFLELVNALPPNKYFSIWVEKIHDELRRLAVGWDTPRPHRPLLSK